jgi:hypothetical protein
VLDRRSADYRALHGWLRLLVRYTLAFNLFAYEFAKVFPLQFQPANFSRLVEQYGQFSPMGVLWSFMGAAIPYIIFAGAAEVTGGLRLLLRRTATLGALVTCAVMGNVVALNFCYDVPVKLYSSNLLRWRCSWRPAMPSGCANVLVLNRPAPPADLGAPRFEGRWMRIAVTVLWIAFAGYQLVLQIRSGWLRYQQTYAHPPRPLLGGAYEVESFRADGRDVPPLITEGTKWRRVEFGHGADGERFAARLPGKLRPERQYGYDERARRTYLVAPGLDACDVGGEPRRKHSIDRHVPCRPLSISAQEPRLSLDQ